ncbi:MAG: hypothetical protein AAFU64_13525 [Bacteroidota bacterium]
MNGTYIDPYAPIKIHQTGLWGIVKDVDVSSDRAMGLIYSEAYPHSGSYYNVNSPYYYQPVFMIIAIFSLAYLIIPNLYFRYFSAWMNALITFWTVFILILAYYA